MAGMTDEYGLTPKQRKFAENVVAGMSLADAYRGAYDTANMKPATIQRNAVALMTDNRVTTCVEAIAARVRQQSEAVTVNDRDMLVTLLRQWSKGEVPATQTQLRAAELLGKACGLYRDVVEDHRERPAALVAAELERRMTALLDAQRPASLNASDTDSPALAAGCGPAGSGEENATVQ